jgi:hypothetical protein
MPITGLALSLCTLQARTGLQDLWRVTVSDMFSETPGQAAPLVRQVVRKLLQGTEVADAQQVGVEVPVSSLLSLQGASSPSCHANDIVTCDTVLMCMVSSPSVVHKRALHPLAHPVLPPVPACRPALTPPWVVCWLVAWLTAWGACWVLQEQRLWVGGTPHSCSVMRSLCLWWEVCPWWKRVR